MQKARVIPFLTIILLQKAQHSVFCRGYERSIRAQSTEAGC